MLKGHLDMIVLAALSSGPAHGYAVIQEIQRRSGGAFELPEGRFTRRSIGSSRLACSAAIGRRRSLDGSGASTR